MKSIFLADQADKKLILAAFPLLAWYADVLVILLNYSQKTATFYLISCARRFLGTTIKFQAFIKFY